MKFNFHYRQSVSFFYYLKHKSLNFLETIGLKLSFEAKNRVLIPIFVQ